MSEHKEQKEVIFYPQAEMGYTIDAEEPHKVFLHESFLEEKLKASGSNLGGFSGGTVTNVGCPFCKKGSLKLEKIQPHYAGNPRVGIPSIMHHVGNSYEFVCSNSKCDGRFSGSYTWMYID